MTRLASNVKFIELEAYKSPVITEEKRDSWVSFGEKNDYYQYLIDRYNTSTTNNAVINAICKLIYGKGLDATDSAKKPNEYAQMKMLFKDEVVRKAVIDYYLLGQYALQVIYNKAKNAIVQLEHVPVQLLRADKCNDKGEITGYWYSDNWKDVKKFPPKLIPAFGYGNKTIEILFLGNYTVGQKYYSNVDYVGSLPYAKLEEEIAEYLINDVQNGFSGTTVVNFNGIHDEKKRELIEQNVQSKLTGSKGKKLIVSFNMDETKKTTIDSVPLNDAPKHYEYLSEEARGKILLGHNVTSGLIFGIPSANGFSSNADELKNAYVLFENMTIRPKQASIISGFDQILQFNKISLDLYFKTLQPLEFVDIKPALTNAETAKQTGVQMASIDEIDLEEFGEEIDLNEWELIDSRKVESVEEDEKLDKELELLNNSKKSILSKIIEFASVSTGIARPDLKSSQDGKLFMSRYRYSGNPTPEREFCKKMMRMNKLYRKEDIDRMSKLNVNPGFGMAPNPNEPYDIFLWKGGGKLSDTYKFGTCQHFWVRETYKRFTDPRKKGAEQVTPAQARKAGEILPTVDKRAYIAPHDM